MVWRKTIRCVLRTTLRFRVEYLCRFIITTTIIICKCELAFVLLFSQFSTVLIVKKLKYSRVRHARFSFGCNNYFVLQTVLQQTQIDINDALFRPPPTYPAKAGLYACVRVQKDFKQIPCLSRTSTSAKPHPFVFHFQTLYFIYRRAIIKAHNMYVNNNVYGEQRFLLFSI